MTSLNDQLAVLDRLAPLRLAGSWDNVGLLLQGDRTIEKAVVCIDLTADVLAEALNESPDLIIAYHPTWFTKLRRLTDDQPHGNTLRTLLRNGIHLYSPHTALDAVEGGIADWLLEPFPDVTEVVPIEPNPDTPSAGAGRRCRIRPTTGADLLSRIKHHLGLEHLRVAGNIEQVVSTVAVCPGSGTSVFKSLESIDLLLTGEMSHHDLLGWAARGTAVVLTDHSNTERGYLPRYAGQLADALNISVHVAQSDRDPLVLR